MHDGEEARQIPIAPVFDLGFLLSEGERKPTTFQAALSGLVDMKSVSG